MTYVPGEGRLDRRRLLLAAASLPLASGAASAEPGGDELPLLTTGLEHFGMTVPDVAAAAQFYSAVFGHGLFREKDPPLRYYVMTGKAYIAIGSRPNLTRPTLDHYCALVEGYDRDRMNIALAAAGMPAAARGVVPDPDRIGLQLLKDPAGLTDTNVPADRLLQHGYGLVQPFGMDHVLLRVGDLERSARFYDRFFARARAAERGEIWYRAADTTVRLAPQARGRDPAFARFGIRVGPFDAGTVQKGLAALGATMRPVRERGRLRFDDPNGFEVELIAV